MYLWLVTFLLTPTLELPYDGVDQDGDGADLVDVDGDGWASELAFGRDCNDRDPTVHPGALDWRVDGIDQDCDGSDTPLPRWWKRWSRGEATWQR